MRFIIITSDNLVSIDGVSIPGIDMSSIDPNIHAVQWYDDHGHIEYVDDTRNKKIEDISEFEDIISSYHEKNLEYKKNTPPNNYSIWNDDINEWEENDILKSNFEIQKQIDIAKAYLQSTDWVVIKIVEAGEQGIDTISLLELYADIIEEREEKRNLINSLEKQIVAV